MLLPKKNLACKIALYYEKAKRWAAPFGGIATLLDMFLRKKNSYRTEIFLDVPVYFISGLKDLSVGEKLLKDSADLLNTTSPFWATQVKNVFASIMIHGSSPALKYDPKDKCLMMNPLRFSSPPYTSVPWEKRIVMFTWELVGILCVEFLYQGRFGYFGVKNCRSISFNAAARFLRKCNSGGNFSHQLSNCYQEMDKARPGRNYYERFMLEKNEE